jgi:hypothetical protein
MTRVLRWVEGFFAAATMLIALYCLVLESDPTTFGLEFLGFAMIAALCFALTILARAVSVVLSSEEGRIRAFIARPAFPLLALSTLGLCLVLTELSIPSTLRFVLSRDALETAARNTHEEWWLGEEGKQIGLYKIEAVDVDNDGEVYFDLGGCGMLDRCWLMYEPRAGSPRHRLAVRQISERWWLLRDAF